MRSQSAIMRNQCQETLTFESKFRKMVEIYNYATILGNQEQKFGALGNITNKFEAEGNLAGLLFICGNMSRHFTTLVT